MVFLLFASRFSDCFKNIGRVPLSRFGRKAFAHDENRRATYSISNRLMVGSESIFNTFGAQVKQLVAVCNIETTLSLSQ